MLKKLIIILIIITAMIVGVFVFRAKNNKELSAAAPKTGLVGYWTMDANDATSTPYAFYDKSGFNNNITSNGSPPLTTGKIKQALNLQGNPHYASVASAPFNFGTGNFSASVWMKSNSAASTYSILDKYNANSADEKGWFILESADVIKASVDNGSIDITGTTPIRNGIWYHVVLVRNGDNAYTYVNGVQDGTVAGISARSATSAALLYIGVEKGTSQFFNGGIDDVRIYNRALSAQEVANLYNSAKINFKQTAQKTASSTNTGQLVGHWTMDSNDTNGTKVYDRSGSNNTVTATYGLSPTSTVGKIKQAVNFNTVALTNPFYLSGGDILNVDETDEVTLSAWIKTTDSTIHKGVIFKWDATGCVTPNQSYHMIVLSDGRVQAGVNSDNEADNTNTTTKIVNDGQWHLLTLSAKDGTNNYNIYIDGVNYLQTTKSGTGIKNSTIDFYIGQGDIICSGEANRKFIGQMDDARVYNRALSAQEVANLYNSAKVNFVNTGTKTGLVGYWTMDANDATSTPYAFYDKSGFNNNITSNGSPPLTTGKIKQALNLQGSPHYASVASAPFNFGTGNFTASVWIKPNTAAATYSILDKYNTNAADDRGWFIFESADVIKASIDNGSVDITGTAAIRNGVWYHVVLVRNGNNAYTYVNGVQDGTVAGISARSATSAALLYIGVEKGTSQFFNGGIDDVRIYNRALSAQEVANLYNSAKRSYQ